MASMNKTLDNTYTMFKYKKFLDIVDTNMNKICDTEMIKKQYFLSGS